MKKATIVLALLLSACAGDASTPRAVSRANDGAHPAGMTYEQFSNHGMNAGARDSAMVQKRFLLLDRDNNGVLSSSEFSDY